MRQTRSAAVAATTCRRTQNDWMKQFAALALCTFLVWPLSLTAGGVTNGDRCCGAAFQFLLADAALTVSIKGVSLRKVLEALARQIDLSIYMDDATLEDKVWAEFERLPLARGIKQLLHGQNYALIYSDIPSSGGSHELKPVAIRVFATASQNQPQRRVSALPEDTRRISHAPPLAPEIGKTSVIASRVSALRKLGERAEEQVLPELAFAIHDEDLYVREVALEILQDIVLADRNGTSSEDTAIALLAQIALTDPSADLRTQALELLAETGKVAALNPLQHAIHDSDPEVSDIAMALFENLEAELRD